MVRGEIAAVEAALAALYLRGFPRPWPARRARWPRVAGALLSAGAPLGGAPEALRASGLGDEAALLEAGALSGALERAAGLVLEGRVLTAASPSYPRSWREALGGAAPPALWSEGRLPRGRALAVVGSRRPGPAGVREAEAAAASAVQAGAWVVGGGCAGVDRAAARAALRTGGEGRVVEVLPCGLESVAPLEGASRLSVCPPGAPFAAGQAAERNALVYSLARAAIVVEPRYNAGGTWHGALDALRRRLAVCGIPAGAAGSGGAALAALGARWLAGGAEAASLLGAEPPLAQPGLFGAGRVGEAVAWLA